MKIENTIRESWLWKDPVKLKWWIDIVLLAEEKGYADVSVRELKKRWEVGSHNTIKSFLDRLEKDGMIIVNIVAGDTRDRHTSVTHVSGGSITRITPKGSIVCESEKRVSLPTQLTHVSDTPLRHTSKKSAEEKKAEKKARFERARLAFVEDLRPYLQMYGRDMVNEFYAYWSEPNKTHTKMRFEQEKTWDLERRLARWARNNKERNNGNTNNTVDATTAYVLNRIAAS